MDAFRNLERIGRGSFGVVYRCTRVSDDLEVVIKQATNESLDEDERRQAENEVRVLSRLHHKHIIRYHASFFHENRLCIVTELAEQGDLAKFLHTQKPNLLPEAHILSWFWQLLDAVHYMHLNHILHRDLKTQNIFITSDSQIKLGDFGIAKSLECTAERGSCVCRHAMGMRKAPLERPRRRFLRVPAGLQPYVVDAVGDSDVHPI